MKRLFAFATAALLSTTAAALANTTSYVLTAPDGNRTCKQNVTIANDPSIGITANSVAAGYENDACLTGSGAGFVVTIKDSKDRTSQELVFGVNGTLADRPFSYTLVATYPLPAIGGKGQYGIFDTADGKSVRLVRSGTYTRTK